MDPKFRQLLDTDPVAKAATRFIIEADIAECRKPGPDKMLMIAFDPFTHPEMPSIYVRTALPTTAYDFDLNQHHVPPNTVGRLVKVKFHTLEDNTRFPAHYYIEYLGYGVTRVNHEEWMITYRQWENKDVTPNVPTPTVSGPS
jgi:hypothetical protein